jgi:hypothetical protein
VKIVFLFLVLSLLSEGEEKEKEEVQLLEDRTVPPFKLNSNQFKSKRPLRQHTRSFEVDNYGPPILMQL